MLLMSHHPSMDELTLFFLMINDMMSLLAISSLLDVHVSTLLECWLVPWAAVGCMCVKGVGRLHGFGFKIGIDHVTL
jgi:hypothetical protein